MKTLKDYISAIQAKETQSLEESVEPEVLSAENLEFVSEEEGKQNHTQPHDPPAVLIMKRKSIRQFPNGQRVALYYVDKINKYVTVPYTSLQWSATPEQTVLDKLKMVVEDGKPRFFDNEMMVSKKIAEQFLDVYYKLNTENKKKLVEMAENNINKAIDFVKKLSK